MDIRETKNLIEQTLNSQKPDRKVLIAAKEEMSKNRPHKIKRFWSYALSSCASILIIAGAIIAILKPLVMEKPANESAYSHYSLYSESAYSPYSLYSGSSYSPYSLYSGGYSDNWQDKLDPGNSGSSYEELWTNGLLTAILVGVGISLIIIVVVFGIRKNKNANFHKNYF